MKILSLAALLVMSLTMVSCGNKNSSGGGASNKAFSAYSTGIETRSGSINVQNLSIVTGGVTYTPTQQSLTVIYQALNASYAAGIQPNAAGALKVKVSGTTGTSMYGQQSYQTGYGNSLTVTGMTVERW